MSDIDISYTDTEWNLRKKLLADAADSLEQRISGSGHAGIARVTKQTTRTLGITVNIATLGLPSATQWEALYRYVAAETRAVADGVNSSPENRLGDRQMLYRVLPDNPVFTSRQSELMRNFWTHNLRQTAALRPISASFYFPYTPPR